MPLFFFYFNGLCIFLDANIGIWRGKIIGTCKNAKHKTHNGCVLTGIVQFNKNKKQAENWITFIQGMKKQDCVFYFVFTVCSNWIVETIGYRNEEKTKIVAPMCHRRVKSMVNGNIFFYQIYFFFPRKMFVAWKDFRCENHCLEPSNNQRPCIEWMADVFFFFLLSLWTKVSWQFLFYFFRRFCSEFLFEYRISLLYSVYVSMCRDWIYENRSNISPIHNCKTENTKQKN